MKKLSPFLTVLISLLLLSVVGKLLLPMILREPFGAQGGEMVQLATSHVPTMEDVQAWKQEQRQIRKDIINMTGYW